MRGGLTLYIKYNLYQTEEDVIACEALQLCMWTVNDGTLWCSVTAGGGMHSE